MIASPNQTIAQKNRQEAVAVALHSHDVASQAWLNHQGHTHREEEVFLGINGLDISPENKRKIWNRIVKAYRVKHRF